jgi:hypothetical protein
MDTVAQVIELERRLSALEDVVAKMMAGTGVKATAGTNDLLPFDKLSADWAAEKVVKKDPKSWKGESMVGKRFSECAPEYLDQLAKFFEWCAAKELADGKLNNKGKPWSEFDGKLARTFAAAKRAGVLADAGLPGMDDGSLPF